MSGAIVSDPFTDAQDAVRDNRMEAILGACGVKDFKRLAYHRRVPSSASTTTRDRRVARTTGPAMQAESDAFAPLEASSVLDDLNNDVFGAGAVATGIFAAPSLLAANRAWHRAGQPSLRSGQRRWRLARGVGTVSPSLAKHVFVTIQPWVSGTS